MGAVRRMVLAIAAVAIVIAVLALRPASGQEQAFTPAAFLAKGMSPNRAVGLTLTGLGKGTLVAGGTAVPVTWRRHEAPDLLRVAAEDRRVWYFLITRTALRELVNDEPLEVPDGWRAASLGPAAAANPIYLSMLGSKPGAFAHTSATTADWYDKDVFRETSCTAAADGGVVITLPDGSVLPLAPDTADGASFGDPHGRRWGAIATAISQVDDKIACEKRLRSIAEYFFVRSLESSRRPRYDGTTLFLSWCADGSIPADKAIELFRCPSDRDLRPLDSACRKAYGTIDLRNPPDDLCSFAGRDFTNHPVGTGRPASEPVACCRCGKDGTSPHHRGGLPVAFADGTAKFMTREELGLAPDAPIVVGPNSKSPILRKLIQFPKR